MVVRTASLDHDARYLGLRMTADEFLELPESPIHYELANGVVVMSPSPSPPHQRIVRELLLQIAAYLDTHALGEVLPDIDVKLRDDLVYRPDIVFLNQEKAARVGERVTEPPDLVVEIISPSSRSYDSKTKRADYEAAGVAEYWLIDPERKSMTFLVLEGGAYREAAASGERYASKVLPGFQLDLARIHRHC